MYRRNATLAATAIPRHTWDPKRFDHKWYDSYGKRITQRRYWPAKKYSIGLEPQTQHEWLQFSLRNLAYAYNGALRACGTFPEMVPYYQEMKLRGVKMDVDTMFVMLSRASRYEKISVPDVFKLYDEMVELGAKTDLSIVEVLHTLWEHSAACEPEWREARRAQLVGMYNVLAKQDMEHYGEKYLNLMTKQFDRYRTNINSLGERVMPIVWQSYISRLRSADTLLEEMTAFLWEFVGDEHPYEEMNPLQLTVPRLYDALERPRDVADEQLAQISLSEVFPDDVAINTVFLTALERVIDYPLTSKRRLQQRGIKMVLVSMLWKSGALISSDVYAQVMDIVKYSDSDDMDLDAVKYLKQARKISSVKNDPHRDLWLKMAPVVDPRVLGRYIACRDPWSPKVFSLSHEETMFPVMGVRAPSTSKTESDSNDLEALPSISIRTTSDVEYRWKDLKKLVKETNALEDRNCVTRDGDSKAVEVFTGLAIFIRRLFNYESHQIEIAAKVFEIVKELKASLDKFCAAPGSTDAKNIVIEPELECWESMLQTLKSLMDYLVTGYKPSTDSGKVTGDKMFNDIAAFRMQMLEESKERFGGRFSILWLQEI